ncbi:MAG: hypothetical protein EP299_01545, partial [Acidobacteria bacterium]
MAADKLSLSRKIFGSNGPTLEVGGDLEPGAKVVALSADLKGGKSFDALGGRLKFAGSGGAGFDLEAGEIDLGPASPRSVREKLAPLGSFAPPEGKQWGVLDLHAGVNVSGSGSTASSVAVSVTGKAALGFRYRTVRAVPAADNLATALPRVLETVRLPFSFDLESFRPNQWHEMSFDASLSVSAALAAGKTLTLDSRSGPLEDLLPEDSPEVAAQINLLAKASLGLELVDNLRVGAGRLPADKNGWVRCRLERSKQNTIAFGTSFALDLWYNKEILERVLDSALGRAGYSEIQPKLLEIAEQIDPDDLTLEGLRSRLSTELFELAKETLPIEEATGKIAARASGLLALVQKVQTVYAELDGEYQGLVDHLLASAGLGPDKPLRQALEELQGLEDLTPEELIDRFSEGKLGRLEPLIDLLARRTVNELLLDGGLALRDEVQRLAQGAKKTLALIEEVDGSELIDVLEKVTGSGRARRVVELLESAPTDAESFQAFLESKVDPRLRGLIDRLLGRVGDKLPKKTLERRLARLREWAQKVDEALTDAATIDQRLRTEIEKIHDRVGFVVAFTIDRTTRRATVLDVELDPSSKGCRQAFRALCQGKIDEFTEKLPFEKDPESDDDLDQPDPDFRLHHFVLTTDRSTAVTWLFSPSVGAGTKRITKAFDSSRIEIRQSNGVFDRQGSYSGGVVQTTGAAKEGMLRSWMGSIWLTSEAHAEDPSLQAPYTRTRHVLRFATLRFDDDLKARRRVGLDEMLRFLGFGPGAVTSRVPAEATAPRIEAEPLPQSSAAGGEEIDPTDGPLAPL